MDRHSTRREVFNFKCLSCCCSKSMFGTKRKKKGENPEPSSPKVTCIGQVRVKKSKKQGKRLRSRSKRQGGDVSFRQEQRWVQLPVTICRAFGADGNCLLPCRGQKEKSGSTSTTCCGALFTRWDGKERDIEVAVLVEKEPTESCRSRRRHVFEDIDIEAEGFEVCAPPKNALLLMRCRSDPLKMAALANRFYQHNNVKQQVTEQKTQDLVNNPETVSESNLGKQETELVSSETAKATDSPTTQFLLNQDIEDTTESESESEDINSEQESETQVEVEVEVEAEAEAEAEVREELGEGETETETAIQEQESGRESTEEGSSQQLPECLMMMMMYEPKLSMEVSKETWVSTTDFIRCLPERPPVIKTDVQDEPKKRIGMDAQPHQNKHPRPPPPPVQQAARSSCSYPPPTASKGFEPLALTRCKSEPKRSAPDACSSWKMEPHRPAIGAAGAGC